jgi:hypothetical protein
MQVMKAIANYDLEAEVVGLSADNTDTTFGGKLIRGKENVLTKIKSQLNRNMIGFGCSAHVHNCAKTAFDIEVLFTQIFGYFHV